MLRRICRRQFLRGALGLGVGLALPNLACARGFPAAEHLASPHVREAMYYTATFRGGSVRCQLCPNRCAISSGSRGACGVRENWDGKLYTLVFGNPCAVQIDPIEKKPFYHFLPGHESYSLSTAGCNLNCLYCQNWHISQRTPEETDNQDLPPEAVVAEARKEACASIAYTYAEPTVFYEYMLTTARLAREAGVKNVVVTNGYINSEPLRELCRAVDAIKVDLKAFRESFYEEVCGGTLSPVLEALKVIAEEGVHLEIVNLVVPNLNDREEELRAMARWIMENLGPDVPTHFLRFFPQYKLANLPPTPVETLERAHAIARREGINYVYVDNVPGNPAESTYCSSCGGLLIVRIGLMVQAKYITAGKCGHCGTAIPGVWA